MMIKAIMHGCNGKMGQVIAGLAAEDAEITLVAGIDAHDEGKTRFPCLPVSKTVMFRLMW